MKAVLAGAYGNLGSDVYRDHLKSGRTFAAADMIRRDPRLGIISACLSVLTLKR